jgi:hypothetical protein
MLARTSEASGRYEVDQRTMSVLAAQLGFSVPKKTKR